MIRVENITKVFNPRSRNRNQVLKGVSFKLPEKGLIAIFGKSGSGKTTLLNIIGGLDKQDSGKVYIDNEDTSGKTDYIRNAKIGYIFQNYYLENGYTIAEIMRNAMLIAGFKDEKEISRRTDEVLKLVKMDRYKNKKADALSGGQKQRVAIARALIKGSDIILADEPTGNLDAENTIIIMDILKEISKTQLVVLVTHEVTLIHNYADSHIKIVDGELKDNEELEKDIKYEVNHNNIYVSEEDKHSYKIGKTNVNVYGDEIESDIELFTDKGSVYLKAGENVKILDENSEKKIVFSEAKNSENIKEIGVAPKFSKSNSKHNGRLFTLKSIFSARKFAHESMQSTANVFKNLFISVIAIVMCFLSLASFEILNTNIESKQTNTNSLYVNLNTYYDIKSLDQTSTEKLYTRVDLFDTAMNEGDFSFAETNTLSHIKTDYIPRPIDEGMTKETLGLLSGDMPQLNEIVITEKLAETLKDKFRLKEINNDNSMLLVELDGKYMVTGIVSGDVPAVYMNKQDYVNFLGVYNEILFTDQKNLFFTDDYKDNYYSSEIVCDKSLGLQPNETYVEINRNSLYKMVDDVVDADYMVKSANAKLRANRGATSLLIKNSELYVKRLDITREAMNADIRIYVSEQAMDNIFVYLKPNVNALKGRVSSSGIESQFYYEIVTDSKEQLETLTDFFVDELDIPLIDINSIYEAQNEKVHSEAIKKLNIFYIAITLLFLIYYFIEKSGSLKNSKEYGIYRAIGVNRSNLLYKETMITLVENILTYFVCYLVVVILMSVRYYMMNIEFGVFIGIAFGVFMLSSIVMMLISLIPYLFVLVKTPASILSRYDI